MKSATALQLSAASAATAVTVTATTAVVDKRETLHKLKLETHF
jgi:hypothetical protein